ncbi:MAG: hypothetical protein QOC66_1095 [Pseudonocardiales bacterium]|nr:hypothetical protein [Pseudonocardiales bacterium]
MSAIATATTPSTTSTVARPSVRGVLAGGTTAAAAGAAGLYVYGAIAQAVGGKMHAGDPGADHAVAIPPSALSFGVVFCTALGTVLAVILARRASAPARTFVRTAVVLTAVSLVPALLASHTDEATRLTLACGHVLAGVVVIPILGRRLSR